MFRILRYKNYQILRLNFIVFSQLFDTIIESFGRKNQDYAKALFIIHRFNTIKNKIIYLKRYLKKLSQANEVLNPH